MHTPITKSGKHGTLYLYRITYTDRHDDCCPEFEQRVWAYNLEHAEDRFYDSCGDDEGWKIVAIARMNDGPKHREVTHKPITAR